MASTSLRNATQGVTSTHRHNLGVVLRAVLDSPSVSRTDVVKHTGLSKATVSRAVDELLARNLIQEGKETRSSGRGPGASILRPTPELGCVVGVDLGLTNCRLLCADLQGTIIGQSQFTTPKTSDYRALAQAVIGAIKALVGTTSYTDKISAAVIALASRVSNGHTIIDPLFEISQDNAPEASNDFFNALKQGIDADIVLDTDSNMALVGEMHEGAAAGMENAALVTVSTRVSAAIALEGQLLRGKRNLVGRIGNMPLVLTSAVDTSRTADELFSANVVCDIAKRNGLTTDIGELSTMVPYYPELQQFTETLISGLEILVSMLCATTDPDVVVFTGRMRPFLELCLPELERRLRDRNSLSPHIQLAMNESQTGCKGSLLCAIDNAREKILQQV